ncbi:MAG: HAD family hydrolase [Candidatus Thorarchaeota archaeon]|jgi:phosphoglycolate phosphatase
MLKALVFDMDGTITRLTLPLEAMRRDTKKYYISKRLPPELIEPADGISSTTGKARDYFLNNGIAPEEWDIMETEMDKILNQHEGFAAATATPIDGSLEIVSTLREAGFKLAILTNNGRPALNKIMKQIPLQDNFDFIVTRHESPKPKPFPDGLLEVTSKLGLDPSEVVYIGDALIDATAAGRAGIEFWGISTGETPADILYDAGASKVFSSLDGVLEAALSILD